MTARYVRNIQGTRVQLELREVDPWAVKLDATNPRIGFSMRQLGPTEQNEGACELLLTSQEDTEGLKRSIILSGGVQEPVYLRSDGRVAEGNRRVVSIRAAAEEHPGDQRFATMPAWQIPEGTPEAVIQDLLNEVHLGSVRGWAPYERALQMRSLVDGGLSEAEVAERYRMTTSEVRQQLAAVDLMDRLYFPITSDPTQPEHRSKFSYFLEFAKNGRIQTHCAATSDLPERFAHWVRDNRLTAGAQVRRLPKILDSTEATRLLELVGFKAADEQVKQANPEEQELYSLLERARERLSSMVLSELIELRDSTERQRIVRSLHLEVARVLEHTEASSA